MKINLSFFKEAFKKSLIAMFFPYNKDLNKKWFILTVFKNIRYWKLTPLLGLYLRFMINLSAMI